MAPTTTTTTVNLAAASHAGGGKKVQSAEDIMRAIASTMPPDAGARHMGGAGGELQARIHDRINEHEIAYGDKSLPRQRLPKIDNALLDRYQAARQNVLVLGAIQQMQGSSSSKAATHRSGGAGGGRGGTSASGGSKITAAAALANPHAGHAPPAGPAAAGSGSSAALAFLAADDGNDDGGLRGGRECDAASARHRDGLGLGSAWMSFKSSRSKGAASSAGDDGLLSAEPSGVLGIEASYGAATPSKSGSRRSMHRQGSTNSTASRFSACSSYVSAGRSSTGGGRRLGHEASHISSGGSSGHTLRSRASCSVSGSLHRKHQAKRRPPKPKAGRITRAFAEFAARDDWVSQTLLRHMMASIIQARWRGYRIRQRWKADRQLLVEEEQARLCAAETQAAALQEMRTKLAAYQQKQLALAAAQAATRPAAFGDGGGDGGPDIGAAADGSAAAALAPADVAAVVAAAGAALPSSRAASAAPHHAPRGRVACSDSDSDSGWSDVELEDVAAIKFRAVTPPWQKAPEHAFMSARLRQRVAAAAAAALGEAPEPCAAWGGADALGMLSLWDSSSRENTAKLEELRRRRICRKPEPVQLPGLAAAAAAASSDGDAADAAAADAGQAASDDGGSDSPCDAAAAPLPMQLVEQLLLERYHSKYSRLGVLHKMPWRARWLKLQQERAEAAVDAAAHEYDDAAGDGMSAAALSGAPSSSSSSAAAAAAAATAAAAAAAAATAAAAARGSAATTGAAT